MSSLRATQVVWFKRDLRLADHAPLCHAARQGPVLCLFVIEPSMWARPDAARQHYHFLLECLQDLRQSLTSLNAELLITHGEVVDVLGRLKAAGSLGALWSHEETGHDASYQRDRAVGRWCREQGVDWTECPQHGVKRRLRDRDVWHRHWEQHMARPVMAIPAFEPAALPWRPQRPVDADRLGLPAAEPAHRQAGGRTRAIDVLEEFLTERSTRYRGGISSPLSAPTACSRLSPYLAWGCLSMRETVQSTRQVLASLAEGPDRRRQGLTGFLSRLHWHCHFIQKLESEPDIEWRNMHRGYDGLREHEVDEALLQALQDGRTGWPMVDACVAMLRETGWVNFRMRAMLVSVAAYPLWLHWRPVGLWLARQFLDYEPGIHWSQLQMQSGTTGINTTRIYNPVKQARDHDPQGHFVRRWLPALRRVPDEWLFEPWRMPPDVQAACGVRVGLDIPEPVVDLAEATRRAKERMYERRGDPEVRQANGDIVQRHGSRRSGGSAHRASSPADKPQLSLDF